MRSQILDQNTQLSFSVFIFILITSLLIVNSEPKIAISAQDSTELSDVKVAIYNGGHSNENLASRTALISMFEWLNADITLISPEEMLNGALSGHSMLVMPGISPYTLRDEMTNIGYDIIRNFIASGGAYIGIYGGTFFEWTRFPLFDVELQSYLSDLPFGKSLVTINLHKNATGPNLDDLQDSYSTLSWTGSYFDAPDMSHVTTIASYAQNGRPCMVTFTYGMGAVFLSSPHPEIEEGDSRDFTTFQDELNDPDSEWELMQVIASWLLAISGVMPINPIPVIIVSLAVVVFGVIAIALIVIYRKSHIK